MRVLARSGALEELMRSAGIAAEEAWDLHDGWRCAEFPEPGEIAEVLREIAAETGAPAIGAYFMDSDVGVVEAAIDARTAWSGVLDRPTAEDYGAPLDDHPVETGCSASDVPSGRVVGVAPSRPGRPVMGLSNSRASAYNTYDSCVALDGLEKRP